MGRVSDLNEEQRKTLKAIISDFGGPTSTHYVLSVLRDALDHYKPGWELDSIADPQLRSDLDVCMVALEYADAENLD
ncbi:hypothetical protein [Blastopirellula marina]|uniref:Uncharacterized protein n=1 Tax=Blastopirellula marina DSM 3645 TaxID=314230 RepID=A4A091_9BACT|nr:hypothetical protein [Blastopirellula marina]EAQ77877.1 hypothetical protein DSM3645_06234 [Blastopirellula marina DSM 3645]